MQKRNGNSHQSGIILGYVLSLIHIYTIAVVISRIGIFNIVWFLFQQFVKFCCSGWNILLYNRTYLKPMTR